MPQQTKRRLGQRLQVRLSERLAFGHPVFEAVIIETNYKKTVVQIQAPNEWWHNQKLRLGRECFLECYLET